MRTQTAERSTVVFRMKPGSLEAVSVIPCLLCGELLSDTYAASTIALKHAVDASVVADIALDQQVRRVDRLIGALKQHYINAHLSRKQWIAPPMSEVSDD